MLALGSQPIYVRLKLDADSHDSYKDIVSKMNGNVVSGANPLPLRALESVRVASFDRLLIPTGVYVAIDTGAAGFVSIDPAMAKRGLRCVNAPGLIDCGYRGQVQVIAENLDPDTDIEIPRGTTIAWMTLRWTEHAAISPTYARLGNTSERKGSIMATRNGSGDASEELPTYPACTIAVLDRTIDPPCYAHEDDNGLDLRSVESFDLEPLQRRCVRTGISVQVPDGFRASVQPRSGLALREGVTVLDAPAAVIGDDELCVLIVNLDRERCAHVEMGDRIAQLVIEHAPAVTYRIVESLDETERSSGGFGSSGRA